MCFDLCHFALLKQGCVNSVVGSELTDFFLERIIFRKAPVTVTGFNFDLSGHHSREWSECIRVNRVNE